MDQIYVIIPIYNGEPYIKRCLDSLFKQTYKNIKIICINDGSKDKSLDVLYAYKDHIILINQENKGVSAARNSGLDYVESLGKDCLISFVDVDDYLDNDYFERLYGMLSKNDCDISCCSFVYQTSSSSKPYKQIDYDKKLNCIDATKILVEDQTIQSHSHCKLYKNFVWKNVHFPVGVAWMEDQATIFKTFVNAKNGVFVSNYCGYHYWQEGSSACRSSISNKRIIDSINGYFEPYNFDYPFDDKEIKQASINALANVYLMMYPRINKKNMSEHEKNEFLKISSEIKKLNIVKLYKPTSKKEKMKKFVFRYLRLLYEPLYKIFGKINDGEN